jgi:hypothetical protein
VVVPAPVPDPAPLPALPELEPVVPEEPAPPEPVPERVPEAAPEEPVVLVELPDAPVLPDAPAVPEAPVVLPPVLVRSRVVSVPSWRAAQPVRNVMPLNRAIPAVKPSIRLIFIFRSLPWKSYLPPFGGFVSLLFLSLLLRAIRVRLYGGRPITVLTVQLS